MRRLATSLLVAVAGCGGAATDPCAGHTGACLGLRVEGAGSVTTVDQLLIKISGAVQLEGRTPPDGQRASHALPVKTALYLPDVSGAVDVAVEGKLGDATVGRGVTSARLAPGLMQVITVVLRAGTPDGGGGDLLAIDQATSDTAVPADAQSDGPAPIDAAEDFASMADLPSLPDLISSPDLSVLPDQSTLPDMSVLPPRLVFVAPPTKGAFGGLAGADDICRLTAQGAAVPGTFKAVLATAAGTPPSQRIILNGGTRPIAVRSGKVVATDATFFSVNPHTAPIDEKIDGTAQSGFCVWTDFTPQGANAGLADCAGWTSLAFGDLGATGDAASFTANWALTGTFQCSNLCQIYCIEQ